ncbi:hypothetical protein MCP1_1920001 [Candidatus Terasakiella magnetica]|nr:hypothetical protein MCP1_1920001 [Candidatus Terasakiella magnetica]
METFGIDYAAYENMVDQMATEALRSGAPGLNPNIPTKDEIIELYKKAWK